MHTEIEENGKMEKNRKEGNDGELEEINEIKDRAREVFQRNWYHDTQFTFHQPSVRNYSSFFAWDSGWNVIGLTHLDPERAFQELRTVFSVQTAEGRIPHEIRIPRLAKTESFLRRATIRAISGQYDSHLKSFFIDPPSYLLAAEILYNKSHDPRILTLLPAMQKCVEYLITQRNLFGDGLVAIVHPWESGTDAAPFFDAPLGINIHKKFWWAKFGWKYTRMVTQLTKIEWDLPRWAKQNTFLFEDVLMNGLTAAGSLSVGRLCSAAGDHINAEKFSMIGKRLINLLESQCWDEERGFFYPRWNLKQPQLVYRTCASGFAPLLSGLVSSAKAERIFRNYLENPQQFRSEWGVPYNSLTEQEPLLFNSPMLWRGPCVWANMNWIAAKAAVIYNKLDLAREITKKMLKLIRKSHFREFYNPANGEGGGASGFTWPAVVLDMWSFSQLNA